MPGYLVVPVDLGAQAGKSSQIVPPGSSINVVTVLKAPDGFSASVKAGSGGQLIPLPGQGQGVKLCPEVDEGLYIAVDAGQAGQLILLVNGEITGAARGQASQLIAYGRANQVGSVNAGPTVQLYNDVGSGKIIRVHAILAYSAVNGRIGVIRSAYKLTGAGGGVLTQGVSDWLDTRLVGSTIKGIIQGANFDNGLPGGAGAINPNLYILGTQIGAGLQPPPVLPVGEYGYLKEGQGLVVQHNQNGAGTSMDAFFIGEEL